MNDTTADLGPPPAVDVQDPLPEVAWLWRRVMTFVCVVPAVAVNVGIAVFLFLLDDSKSLLTLGQWNIGFAGLAILLYLAGANASEIVKLFQTSKLLAQGVIMQRTAAVETPEGRAEASSTAGIASHSSPDARSAPIPARPVPDSQKTASAAGGAPGRPSGDLPKDPTWQ